MEKIKVLVIDDDVTTCSLLEAILQMEDYKTASVHRVEPDIVALLNREKPDVLVMDFHLGAHESLSHVASIRADTEWQHLPILMTSALDRRQDCLSAGANGFILKPFHWQEVTRNINKVRPDRQQEV